MVVAVMMAAGMAGVLGEGGGGGEGVSFAKGVGWRGGWGSGAFEAEGFGRVGGVWGVWDGGGGVLWC